MVVLRRIARRYLSDGLFRQTNDNFSVALMLTFDKARFLLAGKAEKKAEEYMSNDSCAGPRTVIKVTHQGLDTSSTEPFLRAFKPKVVVIKRERQPVRPRYERNLSRLEAAGPRPTGTTSMTTSWWRWKAVKRG